jgi:hypothetical protein
MKSCNEAICLRVGIAIQCIDSHYPVHINLFKSNPRLFVVNMLPFFNYSPKFDLIDCYISKGT